MASKLDLDCLHMYPKRLSSQQGLSYGSTEASNHLIPILVWPGCSTLTMSLVDVSLKFQTFISYIRQYVLLKKCGKLPSHFFIKNISVFGYKVIKHLTS